VTGLEYLTVSPPNAAVPISDLHGRPLPQHRVYQRNSFPMPVPGEISGEVEVLLPGRRRETLDLPRLAKLEQVVEEMVLECAGNGRGQMSPRYPSVPWLEEGVSTRLLVYAGQLIQGGVEPIAACEATICKPITDDLEMQRSIVEIIATQF